MCIVLRYARHASRSHHPRSIIAPAARCRKLAHIERTPGLLQRCGGRIIARVLVLSAGIARQYLKAVFEEVDVHLQVELPSAVRCRGKRN